MTGRMMEALENVVEMEAPDWVLVYGDTNSTLREHWLQPSCTGAWRMWSWSA